MRRTGLKFARQRKQEGRAAKLAKSAVHQKQAGKEAVASKMRQDAGQQDFAKSDHPVDDRRARSEVVRHDFVEEERWCNQKVVLRRAAQELALRRGQTGTATSMVGRGDSFHRLADSLEDTSDDEECNATVRALYDLDPDRAISFFNIALGESSADRRRKIGSALAGSGLVSEAIRNLTGASHVNSYGAFSLLFLVAKAGEVQPLIQVIEGHPSIELRLAVIRLLASSGEQEILPTLQRLSLNNLLPIELRAAITEVIKEISSPRPETAPSAA